MACVELMAGLALLLWPTLTSNLLLGAAPGSTVGIFICRLGGTALLSLAVACAIASAASGSQDTLAVHAAMFQYNLIVAGLLIYGRLGLRLQGVLLLPGIVLHLVLAEWCATRLWSHRTPRNSRSSI